MRSIPNWLKIGGSLVAVLLAVTLVTAVSRTARQTDATRDALAPLQEFKAEIEKKLPMRVDNITSLVGFDVAGTQVRYRYLIDRSAIDVSTFPLEIRRKLLSEFCTGAEMELFRRLNVDMRYTYQATDGTEITDISFTRAECPKNPQ